MTAPQSPFVWLQVGVAIAGPAGPAGADTIHGHGTTFDDASPSPKDGEGRFELSTGRVEYWHAASDTWREYIAGPGSEYVDMDSGSVWALRPATYSTDGAISRGQRLFTISEIDFDANAWPSEAVTGDVILSRTGGKSFTR